MSVPSAGPLARAVQALSIIVVAGAALLAAGCGSSGGASAKSDHYPSKTITFLVWTSPGGKADTSARTLAPLLEKQLGGHIVVKNETGGGGVAAVEDLVNAPPDGYTIMEASPTLITLPSEPGVHFKVSSDIQPLAVGSEVPYLIVVPANSPFKSLKDMLAFAKANPGKLKVGGPFAIGNHRLHWVRFEQAAGIKATWVPFDGSAESDAAVAGGKIPVATSTDPKNIKQLVDAGKVRALGVSATSRLKDLPDVPTYKELGIDFTRTSWDAVVTRQGVPQPIVDKLASAIQAAFNTDVWKKYREQQDAAADPDGPAALQKQFTAEEQEADRIIRSIGSGG